MPPICRSLLPSFLLNSLPSLFSAAAMTLAVVCGGENLRKEEARTRNAQGINKQKGGRGTCVRLKNRHQRIKEGLKSKNSQREQKLEHNFISTKLIYPFWER